MMVFFFYHFPDVMTASGNALNKDVKDYSGKESAPSSGTAEDKVNTQFEINNF